jgi:Animal haem peroxidase/Cellulose binding domain
VAPKHAFRRRVRRRGLIAGGLVIAVISGLVIANVVNAGDLLASAQHRDRGMSLSWLIAESLDGRGNNLRHPSWGKANQPYSRVGSAHYADSAGTPIAGPNARAVSNRIINDASQNVFSERRVSQWGWTWGQFLDHTFGKRLSTGATATAANIPFDANDPLELFDNDLGVIAFTRSAASDGTGTGPSNPRQQTNTLPSYISGNPVYGASNARLDWLRAGSLDGNPANNEATLLLPDGYLPRATARGNPATAPEMDIDGRLRGDPSLAMIAGDSRANENIALTATHTLFAREHNRIVGLLPNWLSAEQKFQIARRIVIAEEQYITYQEFLPAMGVALPKYTGYHSDVDTTLSTEFATVGYRAHSQIHGEFELGVPVGHYSDAQLDAFEAQGLEVANPSADDPTVVEIAVPLGVAFFNPDLLPALGEGQLLKSIGAESQYNNDENIDNQLRSTLFQVPVPGNPGCLDGPTMPQCFRGVTDLGAIDIERARDHGIGSYNDLRRAYGLAPKTSFTAITGESTDAFGSDPLLTRGHEIDDPNLVDVLSLADIDGRPVDLNDPDAVEGTATRDVRRTTIAARLKAISRDVNAVDAFVGMVAEPHVPGTEFGETQLAIWTREFQRLRDGDRFFYGYDQGLSYVRSAFGLDYRRTLAQVIAANTEVPLAELNPNVFLTADDDLPATTCTVSYRIMAAGPSTFHGAVRITNDASVPVNQWVLRWQFANGQRVSTTKAVKIVQSGPNGRDVAATPDGGNATIGPGRSIVVGFNADWDHAANAKPPNFTLNGSRCAVD